VGEDARNGRLYLPLAWMREAGLEPEAWLAEPRFTPALAGVVRRLLQEAEALYEEADQGIRGLPRRCRPSIGAARLIYAEIGRQVERAGLDSVSRRAVVPASRKLALLSRATLFTLGGRTGAGRPVMPEARFLVQAAATAPVPMNRRTPPWWAVGERAVVVLELFSRLEQRDRLVRMED
jgi:phytoene synthase